MADDEDSGTPRAPDGPGQDGPAKDAPAQVSQAPDGSPEAGRAQAGPEQPSPAQVGPEQAGSASGLLAARAFLGFIPPVTLITALLFYFGWARTYSQARAMGADASVFGYTTQDYLLRSVDSLYFPLILLTGVSLLALLAHQALAARLRAVDAEHPDPWLERLGAALLIVGSLMVVYGLLYTADALGRSRFLDLTGPLALGLGVLVAAYGGWLRVRARGAARVGAWGQVPSAPWAGPVAAGLLLCLFALSLFWAVGNYAVWRGQDLALVVANSYELRPGVVIQAAERLGLEGVTEEPLGDPEDPYAYRYSGLRLLDHVAGTYFLMPADWPYSHRLILLKDTEDLQVELTAGQ